MWKNFVQCKYLLLSLINNDLTGLWFGRKRFGITVMLEGCWEEEQSLKSSQLDSEETALKVHR